MPAHPNFFRVLILLVLGASSPAVAQLGGGTGDSENPIQLLTRGVYLVKQGKYPEAQKSFEALVGIDPLNSTAHYYLGVCHAVAERYPAAIESLSESVATGFEKPDAFLKDPQLARAIEKSEVLGKGVRAILERDRQRREGILAVPLSLTASGLTVVGGEPIDLESFRGRPVALLFLDVSQNASLEAAFRLENIVETLGGVPVIAVVTAQGKAPAHRHEKVYDYLLRTGIPFPALLSTPELRQQLRPFRAHPTLVAVDANGKGRRIVEGLHRDVAKKIEDALRAVVPEKPSPGEKK